MMSAPNSPKTKRGANGKFLPKPLLFHLRLPNSKTNEPKFWQILSPKNSFAKTSSALFRHLPEYLEGRTPKRKMSFPFLEKIGRAQIRKARNIFSFWGCRVKRGSGGTIRAYDLVSSHHALRAWHITDFGNRFELGTINTQNSKRPRSSSVFYYSVPERKVPKHFLCGIERKTGIRNYFRKVELLTFSKVILSVFLGVETLSVFESADSRLGRK